MKFCVKCDNMYYIRVSEQNQNDLIYYCRKCGYEEDSTTSLESIVVSKTSTSADKSAYLNNINEFTKLDPTLPRVANVPCPNKDCPSYRSLSQRASASRRSPAVRINLDSDDSVGAGAAAAAAASSSSDVIEDEEVEIPQEVIYMRYDDVNMKYVYICAKCDTVWRPDLLSSID